ncbi:MAG TPA: flavin reductase family protein [Devosia sp.]|nr:flavin reductase family protein [Devosia sp.]
MTVYHSYDPAQGHRLPHDPIKAIVAPRPIGWISSLDRAGALNLAPYSYFNIFSHKPPILIFGSEGRKDTVRNIEQTREFVFNLATRDLAGALNETSAELASDIDEFATAGLGMVTSEKVSPPRVAGVAAAMECRLVQVQQLTNAAGDPIAAHLVIGEVVQVHINEACLIDGLFDIARARTIARCGYRGDYVEVERTFEMLRPRC